MHFGLETKLSVRIVLLCYVPGVSATSHARYTNVLQKRQLQSRVHGEGRMCGNRAKR